MYAHITLLVFSRADGLYLDTKEEIDGCPMPMLIHTGKKSGQARTARQERIQLYNKDEDTLIDLNPKFLEGFTEDNPLGITVRTHPSGSMNKTLFFDGMVHFTKQLPKDQGVNGFYSFLAMDSHVSRWNPKALLRLFENRVIPYFFPSHLSIHFQPQDCGVIRKLHMSINCCESKTHIVENTSSVALLNATLEEALTTFRNEENELKKKRGSNATTRAWGFKSGLEPANQNSQGWLDALHTFGKLNDLNVKKERKDLYAAYVRAERPAFTDNDLHLINNTVMNIARNEVSCEPLCCNHIIKSVIITFACFP